MKKYNKLVRDLIPEIIEKTGKEPVYEIADKKQYTEMLEGKLKEEVGEYLEDKNLEELADIMEVIFALANNLGYSEEELIEKRNEKARERGSFKKAIILKAVK